MMKSDKALSLTEYQKLISELTAQRDFDKETLSQKFMLLLEESGEFAKAARKISGITVDANSKKHDIEEEAADIFFVLIDICNSLNINLANAFAAKEEKNSTRSWD